jgi:hypothetical protein
MLDEPTCDQQPDGRNDRPNSEPVFPSPPKSEQKANSQSYTRHFAGDDVEPAHDEQGSN